MAKTHSEVNSPKGYDHQIVTPDYEAAWAAIAAGDRVYEESELFDKGWRLPPDDITRLRWRRRDDLEVKYFRVRYPTSIREKRFYRPKLSEPVEKV